MIAPQMHNISDNVPYLRQDYSLPLPRRTVGAGDAAIEDPAMFHHPVFLLRYEGAFGDDGCDVLQQALRFLDAVALDHVPRVHLL